MICFKLTQYIRKCIFLFSILLYAPESTLFDLMDTDDIGAQYETIASYRKETTASQLNMDCNNLDHIVNSMHDFIDNATLFINSLTTLILSEQYTTLHLIKNRQFHAFITKLFIDNIDYMKRMICPSEIFLHKSDFFYHHLLLLLKLWRMNTQALILNCQAPYPCFFSTILFACSLAEQICSCLHNQSVTLSNTLLQEIDTFSHASVESIDIHRIKFNIFQTSPQKLLRVTVDLAKFTITFQQ